MSHSSKSLIAACLAASCVFAQVVPEATKVRVRLEQPLSSATAEEGQPVQLAVAEDVKVGDVVVIPRDAVVNGTVVQSVAKRRMGRTGKLDFSIDNIVAPDGGKMPVRYSIVKKEGGSHAVSTGVVTAGVAILFFPAAPFFLLRKGKDTVFNKGMVYEVFTDAAYTLKGAKPQVGVSGLTPLKNSDVIELKKAGFSDEIIVARISASPGNYDLDTQSMIDLKGAGVSDGVITAMVKKSAER
jgi:hypothetical protein